MWEAYLSQSDDSLFGAHTTTLDHDEVIVDFTVMGESTHGGDTLLAQIVFGRSIVPDDLEIKIPLNF